MTKYFFMLSIVFALSFIPAGTDKPAYLLYDKNGKAVAYSDMIEQVQKADVLLFGELHDNPIAHWLELQLAKDLYKIKKNDLILGAEMFEADAQLVLNEYLTGLVKESNFEKESKIWNNYPTDYKPLVNFAKQNKLAFVASNIPRRYASLVASGGLQALEKLDKEALRYIAPLPVEVDLQLPAYQNMISMMGGAHGGSQSNNIVYAQAIKDATMAYRISQEANKDKLLLHFNGAYHSDNYEGIVWYLKKYNKKLRVMTISTVEQEDIGQLAKESQDKADFIICVPKDMTKTY